MNSTFFYYQDTLIEAQSTAVQSMTGDSVSTLKKFSTEEVDDIFRAMERKEQQRDSIARIRAYNNYFRAIEQEQPKDFDTSCVPYNFSNDSLVQPGNPLNYLKQQFFSSKDTSLPVFLEQTPEDEPGFIEEFDTAPVPDVPPTHYLRPDWLLGIIIGSLILLAWLKLFYNKFLDQTMQSIFNYQLSTKLLRDQNIFSRRVAFALNLNFVIVGAAFVYLQFEYFKIRPLLLNDIQSYLSYAGILACLLILRYISSHAIGFIFDKHDQFREYLHQLLLIYKSSGIFLLIPVIGIAYIRDDLRIYLIYLSGVLILFAIVLRILKGLKIILNNKDVLIFYLILYLCTLEILPLLIFYRFFSLSILAG